MSGIKLLAETEDDIKFFRGPEVDYGKEWDPAVRARITVERAVVRKLVQTALDQGYEVAVNYGGGDSEDENKRCTDISAVMDAVCACDEEWLVLYHKKSTRKNNWVGEVYLVYGNDGPDVICDYHLSLQELIGEACDYAETLYA